MPTPQKLIDAAVERLDEVFGEEKEDRYYSPFMISATSEDLKFFIKQELTTAYNLGRQSILEELVNSDTFPNREQLKTKVEELKGTTE
jgi:hypothetical protein